MGPDQRRLERQSSMPSERPKSNYGNYPMRYFKISAYGALPRSGMGSGLWPLLFAPGWYGFGLLALAICPGLVWVRAFGPCYLLRAGMGSGFWPLLVR